MVTLSVQLIGLGVLLALSAFFSSAESAFFSLGRLKIRKYETSKNGTEQAIAQALSRPKRLIIDIVIGNNLANIGASALFTVIALRLFGQAGLAIAIGVMTLLLLVFGEITPKAFAVKQAEFVSKVAIHPIRFFRIFTSPVRWIFLWLSEKTIVIVGQKFKLHRKDLTEEELRTMLDVSEKEGILDPKEKELITGVLKFTDTTVQQIMTPRVDVMAINSKWTQRKVLQYFKKHFVAKVPVYEGSIDRITGLVRAKDVLLNPKKNFHHFVRPIILVPETKKLYNLLKEFQEKNTKIAVVLDEYGGTEGVITLEDILEEIFGEIHGEFEEEVKEIVRVDNTTYRILGRANLDEINERIGSSFSKIEFNTLNGLLISVAGRLPAKGDVIHHKRWTFKVEAVSRRRILSAFVSKKKGRRKKK